MRNAMPRASLALRTGVMAAAVALGACSNDSTSTGPAQDPVVASYVLTTVNGQALPVTVSTEGFPQTFSKGTLTVTDTSYQLFACFESANTTSVCGTGFDALTSIGSWTASGGGSSDVWIQQELRLGAYPPGGPAAGAAG